MADARPFGRATVGGNPVGRPRTATSPYQFAGSQRELSGPERAIIAARRWQHSQRAAQPNERAAFQEAAAAYAQGGWGGERPYLERRAAQTGADRSAAAGQWNEGRRLPNDRGFFNPDSKAEGGTGTSPKNPWA